MKMCKRLLSLFLVLQILAGNLLGVMSVGVRETSSKVDSAKRPKVSVIVPVYNVEPYLRECLDSIKNQTLKDIEIICVDDGSTDNSGKILDEYADADNRFTVIHQENKGVSVARNTGLDIATGEYITFADPDDYLQLDSYEITYNSAKNDDVDILQFGHRIFKGGDNKFIKITNNCEKDVIVDRDIFINLYANDYVWNKLYKLNLIKEANTKFIEGMQLSQDSFFTMMVQAKAQKIKVIPNTLYVYRINGNSATHKLSREKQQERQIHCNCSGFKVVFDYYRRHGYISNHEHILLSWAVRRINFWHLVSLKYAQEILDSFGPDIYNPETVKKCNKRIQKIIRELECAAKGSKEVKKVNKKTKKTITKKNTIKRPRIKRPYRKVAV